MEEAVDRSNADILSVSFITFNVAAIFFGVIPTYGVLPYAMIEKLKLAAQAVYVQIRMICTVYKMIGGLFEKFQNFCSLAYSL